MKYFGGIDVSLAKSGFAVVSEDGCTQELHTFASKKTIKIDRVMEQTDAVFGLLDKYGPKDTEFVAIEVPAWGAVRFVAYDIGMAFGIMLEWLVRKKYNYILVHPSKLRTFISPKRYKGKVPTKKWCDAQGVKFPEKTSQVHIFDMADAYVLARIAKLFATARTNPKLQFEMVWHQWKIFCSQDSKGRDVGLLDRPDLYRIF